MEGKREEGERNERGDRGKMLVGLAVDVGDAAAGLLRFHGFHPWSWRVSGGV